jgi:hypothetical protein
LDHETAFIKSFVLPEKHLVGWNYCRKQSEGIIFLHRLADDSDFDGKFKVELKPSQQNPEDVKRILKQCGAPPVCHVMSESSEVDGRDLPLKTAIEEVLDYGLGSVISCIPGQLAYYEGEMPSDRFVLKK